MPKAKLLISPSTPKSARRLDEWNPFTRRLIPKPVGVAAVGCFLILGVIFQKELTLEAACQLGTIQMPNVGSKSIDFHSAYELAFSDVIQDSKTSCNRDRYTTNDTSCYTRKKVNFSNYTHKSKGGLLDSDRELIADLYYEVDSVFEFGVGESTAIAAETNLPRYSGVDSSAEWVSLARSKAPHRFRFYFADIGPTKKWGAPELNSTLPKMALDYQIAPLHSERDAFDVYFVDGRWRVACVMISFLHAMHAGGDMDKVRVVLHDYDVRQKSYGFVESIATIERRSSKAIVLKMKESVGSSDLFNGWQVGSFVTKNLEFFQWHSDLKSYVTSCDIVLISRGSGIERVEGLAHQKF